MSSSDDNMPNPFEISSENKDAPDGFTDPEQSDEEVSAATRNEIKACEKVSDNTALPPPVSKQNPMDDEATPSKRRRVIERDEFPTVFQSSSGETVVNCPNQSTVHIDSQVTRITTPSAEKITVKKNMTIITTGEDCQLMIKDGVICISSTGMETCFNFQKHSESDSRSN